MKLMSWNVNGIRAVLRKELFLSFVESHNPDIFCLQETKAQPGEALIDLPAYHEFWNSASRKGYSGTAIYTKQAPLRVVPDLPDDIAQAHGVADDGYGDPNAEGRVLMAEYESFYLVTVYTPNAKDDLTRVSLRHQNWDPAFLAYCQRLELHKPVVFCGDLNVAHREIDLANPKANRGKKGFTDEERSGFQAFLDAGFVDTLRIFEPETPALYTWWSHFANSRERNVGWRIDYFLVSAALRDKVLGAAVHPDVLGSDHCPVSIELEA